MYFITTKRMLEVCFSAHPNIQYRTNLFLLMMRPVRRACRLSLCDLIKNCSAMCVIRYKGKLDHSNSAKDLLRSHCLSE